MVSIRVIGEDDTIVFASGQAEFATGVAGI